MEGTHLVEISMVGSIHLKNFFQRCDKIMIDRFWGKGKFMKRKIITILLSSILVLNVFLPNVYADDTTITEIGDITVTVNGTKVKFDVPPVMKNNRTLVPLRAIFEAMDANLQWDEKNQSIMAIKNEKFINLVVNSDAAQIDGADWKLDEPATIYKDRTLVPLRFIGEAFDGEVVWDDKTKTIAVTVPPTTFAHIDAPVYINDKKLDLGSFTRIVRNGVTFIPIESLLDNYTDEIYWERKGNNIFVQLDGTNINFYVNEHYVYINGIQTDWKDPLFEYEGTLVAPINPLLKVLGGYSHYIADTQEIYIYSNQKQFSYDFLTKESYKFIKPTNVIKANFVGNRRLMISDNPENLNEGTIAEDNVTLWNDEVDSGGSAIDHRVFGWHQNQLDQPVSIGITIENLSGTNEIEVVNLKGTNRKTANGWVNYDIGLPLAEKGLSGKMTKVKLETPIIKRGETVLLKSFEVDKSNTIGFQYDFTVKKKSGSGKLNYIIRTVLTKNGTDLTTIQSDPVEIDEKARHPRGVWNSSQLETELPTYEVGSKETGYQISNGATDNLMSPEHGIGDKAQMIKNPGHFGASYIVKIPIKNETGVSKTVRVRVGARGGIYNGAVKVDGKVYLIPTLNPMTETANIIDYVVDKESGLIELEIMHAGGSSLPLAIDLITLEPPKPEIPEPTDETEITNPFDSSSDPSDISETSNTSNTTNTSETTDSSDDLGQPVEIE